MTTEKRSSGRFNRQLVQHEATVTETMADRPKVSAVMIFLDAEKYIAEAIDSILAQSYANWELILLDDGSMETSTGIAKRYAGQHADRIRYAEPDAPENRGMS